ncbi:MULTISPECIES: c-type cytochrome [Methylotenera]|uniref:c-type cytochrome n=1 Tax=Methylotenera TaxID=359407 RepID=UPI000366F2E1|nr:MULTISPECIES: c-type cytochrome [Methylotenera]
MLSFFVIPNVIPPVMAETTFVDQEDVAIRFGGGNLELGKNKSKSELCIECHANADSLEKSGIGVPQLAGQYAGYLFKQLRNFKSGERKHSVMSKMVEHLNDEDLENIATYFANQPVMQGKGSKTNAIAQNLFLRGDSKRNIMSCKSCHGMDGKGSHSANDINPVIAGQSQFYLREQLRNWRSAARTNSPDQVMNVIAKSLTDTEIEALAEYISDMP